MCSRFRRSVIGLLLTFVLIPAASAAAEALAPPARESLSLPLRTPFSDPQPDVRVSAVVVMRSGQAVLQVEAHIREPLHIYAQSQPKPFLASRLAVAAAPAVRVSGPFVADRRPVKETHPQLDTELHWFADRVVWEAPLDVTAARDTVIEGTLFAQACEEGRCYEPKTYPFEATVRGQPPSDPAPSGPASAPPVVADLDRSPFIADDDVDVDADVEVSEASESESAAFRLETLAVSQERSTRSIWSVLPFAFLAGLLLNFMPCVLPVVGLKLLSFVQQAQSDRRRILMMNVAYTAGVLTVLLMLATLAVFAGLGWGEQFSSAPFTISLAAVVFTFGLSFLGVWEIPLPGFVAVAGGRASERGYSGAFSKGLISTLLATPCSGPFLGAALAWAVTQTWLLTYAVFLTVGLGMASPYLLIGAFPALIRFLPKPGPWMETFKQVMGFVMLATVVYLLSFVPIASVVPAVLLLLGLGFAVWLAGRTPHAAPRAEKVRVWGVAAGLVMVTTAVAFGWLEPVMQQRFERSALRLAAARRDVPPPATEAAELAWQDYSPQRLEEAIAGGQPVFVDFTADWCLTCKANEAAAVETAELARVLRDHHVVVLRADKTEPNPAADELLRKLGNSATSIPYYAVFHPQNPAQPTVLDGIFTSPQPFIDAILQADTAKNARRSADISGDPHMVSADKRLLRSSATPAPLPAAEDI